MSNVVVSMKMSPQKAGKLYFENERNKERVKALELDLGLMTIARDNAAQLLKSCEQALDKANTH